MSNFRNEWETILKNANEALKKRNTEIIVTNDEGCYSVQIKYADGSIEDFAENYYEHEMDGCITEARCHALSQAILKESSKKQEGGRERLRVTFRLETYIDAQDMKSARTIFENIPLPQSCQFVEVVSVEDAETFADKMHEWDASY